MLSGTRAPARSPRRLPCLERGRGLPCRPHRFRAGRATFARSAKEMSRDTVFTSESVTAGHPDKICDHVSDAILDALLTEDPNSRVAVETLVKTGFVVVAGEVTSNARIDIPAIVRETVKKIGYTDSSMGFDGNTCGILVALEQQSRDI